MNKSEKITQLEKENEQLKQKLALAKELVDKAVHTYSRAICCVYDEDFRKHTQEGMFEVVNKSFRLL